MAFSHTIGGTTFTEASFEGNAYADESTGFPKALEKMVEHVANAYRGTSTTSNAVGTGSKTWTVTNANSQIPAFAVGMPVRVARTAAPTTTYMQGEITAFTASTGSTTVNVSSSLGSGTHTDWTITIGGHQTTASASPLGVAAGGTGAGTHTANNVLVGAGTGAVTSVAPSTSGNVLTSNGSTWSSTAPGHVDLVAIADGSVGSPSLANSGDTNTGVYWPGADQLGLTTAGAAGLLINATGAVTKPLQPAFLVYNTWAAGPSNATGDGTLVTVNFATTVFDQGDYFATNTFTAPVTGRYLFQVQVGLQQTEDATNTRYHVQLLTSNRPYILHEQRVMRQNDGGQNVVLLNAVTIADMDASDTALVKCSVYGGSAVVDIWGNSQPETFFSGCLLA